MHKKATIHCIIITLSENIHVKMCARDVYGRFNLRTDALDKNNNEIHNSLSKSRSKFTDLTYAFNYCAR